MDVSTRFNSTYILLKLLNKNTVPLALALVECQSRKNTVSNPPSPLSSQQKDILTASLPLLKVPAKATEILSAENFPTISLVFPCILTREENLIEKHPVGATAFRNKLLDQLRDRFDLMKPIFLASTFIDPRFKGALFSCQQRSASNSFLKRYAEENCSSQYLEQLTPSPEPEPPTDSVEGSSSLMDDVFRKVNNRRDARERQIHRSSTNILVKLEHEIESFNAQPVLDGKSDPLIFWKSQQKSHSLLAMIARDLLSIQATNCASERVNSVGGRVISDQRHSLSTFNAETLIWACRNKDLLFP